MKYFTLLFIDAGAIIDYVTVEVETPPKKEEKKEEESVNCDEIPAHPDCQHFSTPAHSGGYDEDDGGRASDAAQDFFEDHQETRRQNSLRGDNY